MTVTKSKNMTTKEYIFALADNYSKPSEIELTELAGYLLADDIENKGVNFIRNIMLEDDGETLSSMARFLKAESPDSLTDLVSQTKQLFLSYYREVMETLIRQAKDEIDWDKKNTDKPIDDLVNPDLSIKRFI